MGFDVAAGRAPWLPLPWHRRRPTQGVRAATQRTGYLAVQPSGHGGRGGGVDALEAKDVAVGLRRLGNRGSLRWEAGATGSRATGVTCAWCGHKEGVT